MVITLVSRTKMFEVGSPEVDIGNPGLIYMVRSFVAIFAATNKGRFCLS